MITLFKRRDAYKKVFNTPEGKIVLADLYKFCKVNEPLYVPGDDSATIYNTGLARVGHRIRGILKQSDEEITKIVDQYKVEDFNVIPNLVNKPTTY